VAYRRFSAAAHDGFWGLRVFRDRTYEHDIKPRLPIGIQAPLVSISSRYLIELVSLRGKYEELEIEILCAELRGLIESIEILNTELA
jgi:hypothetical protein